MPSANDVGTTKEPQCDFSRRSERIGMMKIESTYNRLSRPERQSGAPIITYLTHRVHSTDSLCRVLGHRASDDDREPRPCDTRASVRPGGDDSPSGCRTRNGFQRLAVERLILIYVLGAGVIAAPAIQGLQVVGGPSIVEFMLAVSLVLCLFPAFLDAVPGKSRELALGVLLAFAASESRFSMFPIPLDASASFQRPRSF